MFDQDAGKALHRTKGCTVNNNRTVAVVIRAHISKLKTLRHYVIYLYGAQLPFSTNCITDNKINFGSVETGFAAANGVVQLLFVGHFSDFLLCAVPEFCFTAVLIFIVIAEGKTDIHRHIKDAEYQFSKINDVFNFVLQLVVRAVYVRLILSKSPSPRHPALLAGLFVAVYGSELGQPQGKIAIAVQFIRIDPVMMGAVHGFQQILLIIHVNGIVLRLPVIGKMAGGTVQIQIADVRGDYFLIAALLLFLAQKCLQLPPDDRALWQPDRQALTNHRVDHKKLKFFSQLPMVTLFSLFNTPDILF